MNSANLRWPNCWRKRMTALPPTCFPRVTPPPARNLVEAAGRIRRAARRDGALLALRDLQVRAQGAVDAADRRGIRTAQPQVAAADHDVVGRGQVDVQRQR